MSNSQNKTNRETYRNRKVPSKHHRFQKKEHILEVWPSELGMKITTSKWNDMHIHKHKYTIDTMPT